MAKRKKISVSDWANIAKTEDRFRYQVVREARQGLNLKKQRQSAMGSTYTGRITDTGTLAASLASQRKNLTVVFSMKDYGFWVDQGRMPGTWPPVDAIREWIDSKPLKLRDYKTGRFMARTPKNINTVAFLIGRAIERYGITETLFFTTPFTRALSKMEQEMFDAIYKDLDILLL